MRSGCWLFPLLIAFGCSWGEIFEDAEVSFLYQQSPCVGNVLVYYLEFNEDSEEYYEYMGTIESAIGGVGVSCGDPGGLEIVSSTASFGQVNLLLLNEDGEYSRVRQGIFGRDCVYTFSCEEFERPYSFEFYDSVRVEQVKVDQIQLDRLSTINLKYSEPVATDTSFTVLLGNHVGELYKVPIANGEASILEYGRIGGQGLRDLILSPILYVGLNGPIDDLENHFNATVIIDGHEFVFHKADMGRWKQFGRIPSTGDGRNVKFYRVQR